ERGAEQRITACRLEQGERGAELHGIDRAKYPDRVATAEILERRDAGDIARPENRVRKIGLGFGEIGNSVALRHCAMAEPGELRKNEPHPVRALGAAPDLGERPLINALLRLEEAPERPLLAHRAKRPCAGGLP